MTAEQQLIKPVIDKTELIIKVENLVRNDNLSYLEALMNTCEELDLDPEDIAKLVTGPLKDKLKVESESKSLLKKQSYTSTLFEE